MIWAGADFLRGVLAVDAWAEGGARGKRRWRVLFGQLIICWTCPKRADRRWAYEAVTGFMGAGWASPKVDLGFALEFSQNFMLERIGLKKRHGPFGLQGQSPKKQLENTKKIKKFLTCTLEKVRTNCYPALTVSVSFSRLSKP